jgi:hypothetical protein
MWWNGSPSIEITIEGSSLRNNICIHFLLMPQPQDQITSVVAGEIDLIVAGEPVRLRAGRTAGLPGDPPHAAKVGDRGAETINGWTSRR